MKTHFLSLNHPQNISGSPIVDEKHDTYDQAAARARKLARKFAEKHYKLETVGGVKSAWIQCPRPLEVSSCRRFHAEADYRYQEKAHNAAVEWSRQNGIAHAAQVFPGLQFACLPFATLIEMIAAEFSIKTLRAFSVTPGEQEDWGAGSGPLSPERIAMLKENEIYVTGE